MDGPRSPRWLLLLLAVGGVLGLVALAAPLAAPLARSPVPAVSLLLCLPLWATLYAGFAVLYAVVDVPWPVYRRQPDCDKRPAEGGGR